MKKTRTARPSKLDNLAASVAQDWAHQNSAVVNSRRRVLQFEASEVDASIVALVAALTNARERRAKIEATLTGLAAVIAKRT
jgi:hypothetical protein